MVRLELQTLDHRAGGPGRLRGAARGARADRRRFRPVANAIDLRGADLRGAYLIGADLRDADLALADLTGADLRGADLAGADLGEALFLVQSQLDAARGDRRTGLPPNLERPAHWG